MTKPKVIQNDHWQVGILPDTGGSIAFGRIRVGDRWADFMRPTPEPSYQNVEHCASFVLIPWASRLDSGQFRFQGKKYTLNKNGDWAMHGVGRNYPWRLEWLDPTSISLVFSTTDHPGVNYPFQFSSRVEYSVEGKSFTIKTAIKNVDQCPMPAGFGHHPYFQRSLNGPTEEVMVEIPCNRYFDLSAGVPTSGPQMLPERLDFAQAKPLGKTLIDDCLTGRAEEKPVRFIYPKTGQEIRFHSDPIFKIIIFYAPVGKNFFAVEPITHATDGFNLYDKGIAGSGIFVLQSGEQKSGTMSLEIQ